MLHKLQNAICSNQSRLMQIVNDHGNFFGVYAPDFNGNFQNLKSNYKTVENLF